MTQTITHPYRYETAMQEIPSAKAAYRLPIWAWLLGAKVKANRTKGADAKPPMAGYLADVW